MEAKDTVMSDEKLIDILVKASKNKKRTKTYELLVAEAQAEISFKAGYEQRKGEVEMTTVSLADMLREQRQAGRREVVETLPKGLFIADLPPVEGKPYQYLGCYILRWGKGDEASIGLGRLSDSGKWQAKLKEWGI